MVTSLPMPLYHSASPCKERLPPILSHLYFSRGKSFISTCRTEHEFSCRRRKRIHMKGWWMVLGMFQILIDVCVCACKRMDTGGHQSRKRKAVGVTFAYMRRWLNGIARGVYLGRLHV